PQGLVHGALGVLVRSQHPIAMRVQRAGVRFDQPAEPFLIPGLSCLDQLSVAYPVPGTRVLFACQSAISPHSLVASTLRHPAGPSRGSSSTTAPSSRPRSVIASISLTSTYGSQIGRRALHSTIPPSSGPRSSRPW